MLVAPAEKLIPPNSRVVIIADESLYGLNFETLLAPKPHLHYWIDDVTISNANSLAMLRPPISERPHLANAKLLVIGNPVSASTDFPPLPQAEAEIHEVAAHFSTDRETVIVGSNATPSSYLKIDPSTFTHIHFVAHGTASRLSPLNSAVILSPQGDSYKLYARDIVEMPLRAELVTVSACYGSGNRSYSGEGLVGLSWAFLRAGARNVIAALWEANDVSTPKLMDVMYDGINRGEEPAMALREAKLALLHSASVYRRPFYWAPFQLYVGPGREMRSTQRVN
jgi:CHAT domain-containing protein